MRDDFVWLWFRTGGTVSRQTFILGWLLPALIEVTILWQMMKADPDTPEIGLWFIAFVVFGGLSAIAMVFLGIKRLRGLGWPLGLVLLLFVPATSPFTLAVMSLPQGGPDQREA